jgi:glycine/D-amino acid oxidase-like deaminating enzyme
MECNFQSLSEIGFMQSFWETDQLSIIDFSIVGGGILGLFTAYELSLKYPKARIAIFERDLFAAGATSRNAGFACFGSVTEIAADRKQWGDSKTLEIVNKRWKGIQRIQSLLGDKINYENYGGYELFIDKPILQQDLDEINSYLNPVFQEIVFKQQPEKIKEFGFSANTQSLVFNPFEGQIHSGKLILALHELLRAKNVHFFANSEVTSYEDGSPIEFIINNKHKVQTEKLIFCTNAFPPINQLQIKPARGQVLITKPIPNLKLRGCFHFQEGYYYFRNVDNRILFGGGRHLDIHGETDTRFLLNELIQKDLIEKLNTIIAPSHMPDIEQQWSGIMAFTDNKLPMIKYIGKHVIYAMNGNGMGISLSPITAQEITELL